jgi:hypothetical protein
MLVLCDRRALAAFPDLITLFDAKTLLPLNTTDGREGQRVVILAVPAERLNLASTMFDRTLLRPVEKLLRMSFPERNAAGEGISGRTLKQSRCYYRQPGDCQLSFQGTKSFTWVEASR